MKAERIKKSLGVLNIIFFAVSVIMCCGVVFAWFVYRKDFSRSTFKVGEFTAYFDVKAWDKPTGAWSDVVATAENAKAKLDFGNMELVDELPADCNAFFRAKVVLIQDIKYTYSVFCDEVKLTIHYVDRYNAQQTDVSYDYYNEDYRFFDIREIVASTGDVLPSESTFEGAENSPIEYKKQMILQDVAGEQYLYFMLKPNKDKLKNLIQDIPIDWMPFFITMELNLKGEAKTITGI